MMACKFIFSLSSKVSSAAFVFSTIVLRLIATNLMTHGGAYGTVVSSSSDSRYAQSYFRIPCVDRAELPAVRHDAGFSLFLDEFHLFGPRCINNNCTALGTVDRRDANQEVVRSAAEGAADDVHLHFVSFDDQFTPGRGIGGSGYNYEWLVFLRSVRASAREDESVDLCVRRTLSYGEAMTHCPKVCWSLWAERHSTKKKNKNAILVELGCVCHEYLERHGAFIRLRQQSFLPPISKTIDLIAKDIQEFLENVLHVARKYGCPLVSGMLIRVSYRAIRQQLAPVLRRQYHLQIKQRYLLLRQHDQWNEQNEVNGFSLPRKIPTTIETKSRSRKRRSAYR